LTISASQPISGEGPLLSFACITHIEPYLCACQEIAEGTRAPNARKEAEWGITAKDPSLEASTGTSIDEEGGSIFLSTRRRGKESFSSTNMKHLETFLQKKVEGKA